MKMVLDAGALIGLERNDRAMWRRLKTALLKSEVPVTHGGVVGQAWRGRGPRQAPLARALQAIDVRPLDHAAGRAAGELLQRARARDVVDAAIVLLAEDGDTIFTSDPDDIGPLAAATERRLEIVKV